MYQLQLTVLNRGHRADIKAELLELLAGNHRAPLASRWRVVEYTSEFDNRDPLDQLLMAVSLFAESERDPGVSRTQPESLF